MFEPISGRGNAYLYTVCLLLCLH